MIVKDVKPGDIRLDGDTQPRVHLDQNTVEEYADVIQNGETMPPLDVFYDGESYWLADGFHRYTAMTRIDSQKPIKCNVHEGTLDDAKWFSYGVNITHGLRRSNKDKAKAVRSALLHANGAEMSNVQIAEHVGVSKDTVAKYRAEFESTCEISKSNTRTGRDGRMINTSNIGGKQSTKAANHTKQRTSRAKIFKPKRRGGKLPPMISLTLPVNKPEIAAAILVREFPAPYIETLVQVCSKSIQKEKENSYDRFKQ